MTCLRCLWIYSQLWAKNFTAQNCWVGSLPYFVKAAFRDWGERERGAKWVWTASEVPDFSLCGLCLCFGSEILESGMLFALLRKLWMVYKTSASCLKLTVKIKNTQEGKIWPITFNFFFFSTQSSFSWRSKVKYTDAWYSLCNSSEGFIRLMAS